MSRGSEARELVGGQDQVGVVEDEKRRVAAELQRQAFQMGGGLAIVATVSAAPYDGSVAKTSPLAGSQT